MFLNITDYQNLQYTYIITVGGLFGLRKHCPKWKRDWQGVRLTKHSWTISSSPSEMAKIFYPSSTLNPTKLRRLQFILFGAINDSTLLAKTLVPPTRFLRRLIYYILKIPLQCHVMRKRNFISTSICLSVCLNSFPEEFQIRGTDETLMVETAVCPNNLM